MRNHFHSKILCLIIALLVTSFAYAKEEKYLTFSISGIKGDALENATQLLTLERDSYGNTLSDGAVHEIFEKGKKTIATALQPYGYFKASITGELVHKKTNWVATYHVSLGKPLTINQVEVEISGEGKDNPRIKKLLAHFPLKKGDQFTTKAYNDASTIVFNTARSQGYATITQTKHVPEINLTNNYANIILHFDTGPRYYFGETTFDEKKYDINFLKKFLTYQPGEPYSPDKIKKLQTELTNTKYFKMVTINPDIKKAEDEKIPITIDTKPVPSQQYNLGLGYGTNTGVRTSVGVNLYRITDTGQHASAILNLSQVNTGLISKYFIPGPEPAKNQYTIGATIQEFDPPSGKSFYYSGSTGFDTTFGKYWRSSSNLNYLHEKFEVNDSPYTTSEMVYPSLYLSRIKADNPNNPTKASMASIMLRAGGPSSATTFGQAELSAQWIHDITQNSLVILRGNLGATYGENLDEEYPLSLRFFAGGVNSVRGYSEQSLGPGRFLQVASAEFQHRLHGDIYGAVFFDTGNASNDSEMELKRGIGTGLVWHSLIGPIALYVAQANSSRDKPLRIELSIGAGL